jgi:hypothetical protein
MTSHRRGEQSGGVARGAGTDAMPGSPLSAAMVWAPRSARGTAGAGRTPASGSIANHRPDEAGRAARRWPPAGVHSCTLGCGDLRRSGPGRPQSRPAPARRARTSPMAGSWRAGSGCGRCLDLVAVAAAVFLLHHVARLRSGRWRCRRRCALGSARGWPRCREAARPGSRAMRSSTWAWLVGRRQLATLENNP